MTAGARDDPPNNRRRSNQRHRRPHPRRPEAGPRIAHRPGRVRAPYRQSRHPPNGRRRTRRRNVHEVLRTPEFNQAATAALDKIELGLAQLTDEQRAQAWDRTRPHTPTSTLTAMRAANDPSRSPEPEPDNDDNEPRATFLKCDW